MRGFIQFDYRHTIHTNVRAYSEDYLDNGLALKMLNVLFSDAAWLRLPLENLAKPLL